MQTQNWKQGLFYFFSSVFCFAFPFRQFGTELPISSYLIIGWLLFSFFNLDKKYLIIGLKNKAYIFSQLFFLATLLSALIIGGPEKEKAIEVKLSFLLLPYLVFCFNYPSQMMKRFVISFVSGCFFASVFLILRGLHYAVNGQSEYLTYTDFSYFMHTAYFSMYLLLALIFIIVFYPKWFSNSKSLLKVSVIFSLVFVSTIFMCASKMGIICLIIIAPILALYKFKFTIKKTVFLLLGFILVIVFGIKLFPVSIERFKSITNFNSSNIDKSSVESTAVRVLIWKEASTIFKNNLLYGVGVGKANLELSIAYKKNGLTGALEKSLNAHNQYLQTAVGLGLIGVLLLVGMIAFCIINTIKLKHIIIILFVIIITLNFLVESMLQTSAGVLFFMFFYSLFNSHTYQKIVNEKQPA